MKLELAVRLTDDSYEDQKGFSFEIPYGAHEEGVDDKLVDLLNTAVNWTDVVPAMCDHIRLVKPNPVLRKEVTEEEMAAQMELVKAQVEAQQQKQEQQEQKEQEEKG